MGIWKAAFLLCFFTHGFFRTNAMGICEFTENFPSEENRVLESFNASGCHYGRIWNNTQLSNETITEYQFYKDCYDVYQANHTENGIYTILPNGWLGSPFNVSCDMTTSGGGWTVFQRRVDGSTNFYRNWTSYKNGFGVIRNWKDFWLGNEKLYYLTNNNKRSYKLRVDIVTYDGTYKHEEYTSFRIGSEDTKYQLVEIGGANGTAGNGMEFSRGRLFSTFDSDNDQCDTYNCAVGHRGAWWYGISVSNGDDDRCNNCNVENQCDQFNDNITGCDMVCSKSNLNGDYNEKRGENIFWGFSQNCNLFNTEMKIRPSL